MSESPQGQRTGVLDLTDEQVRGYAVSALNNPVLMGLLLEIRAESMRTLLKDHGPDMTNTARGQHKAAEKIQNRLQQYTEYSAAKVVQS